MTSWKHQRAADGYLGRMKLIGLKLWSAGSPTAGTAYLLKPYSKQFPGKTDYAGFPVATDQHLQDFVDKWYPSRFQLAVHANGDAAIEQFIKTIERTQERFGLMLSSELFF